MEKMNYICPKCGCTRYTSDQIQTTGGDFAKIFNVQNKKFTTVSCDQSATRNSTAVRPAPA